MYSEKNAEKLLIDLVSIPSPSGAERRVAEFAVNAMTNLGFDSKIDEVGNAIGARGPINAPVVVLLGHIDTVSSLLPVSIRDGKVFGRGAVDAKGPFAAFISAVAAIDTPNIRYVVIGAVGEETSHSIGARFVRDKYTPQAVIIGEPSGYDGLTIGYKGRVAGTYTSFCDASHSASEIENASELAVQFWEELSRIVRSFANEHGKSIFWEPQCSCEAIEGTQQFARMNFSLRIPPEFPTDELLQKIQPLADRGEISFSEITSAILFSRSSPPAVAMTRALRELAIAPRVKVKTGTCDMNIVGQKWDAPMIAYGPGDSSLDHTAQEHIVISEYLTAVTVLTRALKHLEYSLLNRSSAETSLQNMR